MAAASPLRPGPLTADVRRDNGYLVEIKVPYDLTPMGIAHTLVVGDLFNNPDFTNALFDNSITMVDTRACTFKAHFYLHPREGRKIKLLPNRGINPLNITPLNITIEGIPYTDGILVGSGAYGFVYSFKLNGSANRNICIKFQLLDDEHKKDSFVKEGIINHIIYESTKYNTHTDCQYTPEFRKMFKIELPLYGDTGYKIGNYYFGMYIVQLCNGDYNSLITDPGFSNSNAFMQLARKLDRLWELYNFNHGDFHAKNSLFIGSGANRQILLTDFGFSAITLKASNGRGTLDINTKGHRQRQERDLTHLVAYLRKWFNTFKSLDDLRAEAAAAAATPWHVRPRPQPPPQPWPGANYAVGTRILSDVMYNDFQAIANRIPIYQGVPHFVVYDWMDNLANNNPSGNSLTYVETYNTAVNPITDARAGGCIPAKIAWAGPAPGAGAVPPPGAGAGAVPPPGAGAGAGPPPGAGAGAVPPPGAGAVPQPAAGPAPAAALNAPARAVVVRLNTAAQTYTSDRTDVNATAWINAFRALCTYTKNNPNQNLYIEVYNSLQSIIQESERAGSPLNNSIGSTVAQIKADIQTKIADLGRVNPQRAQSERTAAATYKRSPTNSTKDEWIRKFVEVKQQLGQAGADARLAKAMLFATVSLNSTVSSNTTPICWRKSRNLSFRTSIPSRNTWPELVS
jgi:hypothetical protein